jgi:PAS domain-containing protein
MQMPERSNFVAKLKTLSGAFLDAYVVVDPAQHILDFNRVFYSLFPRSVARKLKSERLESVLKLELAGEPLDLATKCLETRSTLRYDEIRGHITDSEPISLIAAASPLLTEDDGIEGVFLCLRNVTDEAQVQSKYRTMLDDEARQRELLEQRIRDTEAELVTIKDELNRVEEALRNYEKGLLI